MKPIARSPAPRSSRGGGGSPRPINGEGEDRGESSAEIGALAQIITPSTSTPGEEAR